MKRSSMLELLDLGPSYYTQEEYDHCLQQLARVGCFLGGDRATLKAFQKIAPVDSILDVGCGGGQFTRELGKKHPAAAVVGIDISSQAIDHAKKNLAKDPQQNVSFEIAKTPHLLFPENSFDVVASTLLCHHLCEEQLIDFLRRSYRTAKKCVIINDLHRHWLACLSFQLIAKPLFNNRLISHDGLLSIKRAFTKADWKYYVKASGIPWERCTLSWHWAFRWILVIDAEKR